MRTIQIDKAFSESQVVHQFKKTIRISRLTLGGAAILHGDNSLIRVILVEDDFHEYLVYEVYPLIIDSNSFQISEACEETCFLDAIVPYSLKIELIDASIHIDQIALFDSSQSGRLWSDDFEAQTQSKLSKDFEKIRKINENIKKKSLQWIAGETNISQLTYEEKKKLFSRNKVPNLQGAEYYKGGILEINSGKDPWPFSDDGGSSLVEAFDWRNRHGADNPDSPYYDGDPTGSGWITPVKRQGCSHCWVFSPVHSTEAFVNLYFNQHLDLDLSEQDVASCSGGNAGCCDGGYIGTALNHIINTGVVDESCFPYSASCESCGYKCTDPSEFIKIGGKLYPGYNEDEIKQAVIEYGPITCGISSWWHFMVLVGFDKDHGGKTVWIFKNSWGTGWGENGYGYLRVNINDLYGKYALLGPVTSLATSYSIGCYDMDNDGYYNWGISQIKPSSCPAESGLEKDCDDSNPYLGPFDTNGHCIELSEMPGDFDGDGAVTYNDLFDYFLPAYGKKSGELGYLGACDLNQDGSIDMLDYAEWYELYMGANPQ
jgi:C1A family cysteine protease